jgi:hypothetical protein
MFWLLNVPSSRVVISLKMHIFTNVYSLVHFVSTICITFTVIDVHSHLVSVINWYFHRCYCTDVWYCIILFHGVCSYGVCCTWFCVSLIVSNSDSIRLKVWSPVI